jgi:hypothetical protein
MVAVSRSRLLLGLVSFCLPLASVSYAFPVDESATSCTLAASGGDDAPSFVKAVQSCSTVTIPASTTLNISSKMDMTGVSNKLIVGLFVNSPAG